MKCGVEYNPVVRVNLGKGAVPDPLKATALLLTVSLCGEKRSWK